MIEFDWTKNIVSDSVSNRKMDASAEVFKIKDIWTKKNWEYPKALKAEVKSHDVLMVRLILIKK